MTYAHVHDDTVADEFYRAMEEIEGPQFEAEADDEPTVDTAKAKTLLDQIAASDLTNLTTKQRQMLDELRHCLAENPSFSSPDD
ncbi:MAG: hypothetical protein AAF902_07220 [Chloroflexota bacterium]